MYLGLYVLKLKDEYLLVFGILVIVFDVFDCILDGVMVVI